MGMLSRFRDIMASNVNALLDKAEDPEKKIAEYMRGLHSDLGKVKAETASVLADESRAKRALEECRAEITKLQRYAEKAAEAGDDVGALKFLEKKAAQAIVMNSLQTLYDTASANATGMKSMEDKLGSDLSKLEARRAELQGKMAAAKAQQRLNSANSPLSSADSVFGALEEKVNTTYDEAMSLAELRAEPKDDLDDLIAQLNKDTDTVTNAEDELAALKRKLKKTE